GREPLRVSVFAVRHDYVKADLAVIRRRFPGVVDKVSNRGDADCRARTDCPRASGVRPRARGSHDPPAEVFRSRRKGAPAGDKSLDIGGLASPTFVINRTSAPENPI